MVYHRDMNKKTRKQVAVPVLTRESKVKRDLFYAGLCVKTARRGTDPVRVGESWTVAVVNLIQALSH